MRRGVRICLRNKIAVIERLQERLLVPRKCGHAVLLPEALGVFLEAVAQQLELFGLRRVHALVNCVHDLRGLIDHRQRRADGSVSAPLADLLYQRTAARRNAEDVGVLTSASVAVQKAREVCIHARVEHLAPRSRDGVRGVAEDVQQADVVETKTRHERVFDERGSCFGQLLIVLVVVAHDRQDFF